MVNIFNYYFINVGSSLARNFRSDINLLQYVQNIAISLHIPEPLKLARVIPKLEGENYQLVQNYRPYRHSQIFEKVVSRN